MDIVINEMLSVISKFWAGGGNDFLITLKCIFLTLMIKS